MASVNGDVPSTDKVAALPGEVDAAVAGCDIRVRPESSKEKYK